MAPIHHRALLILACLSALLCAAPTFADSESGGERSVTAQDAANQVSDKESAAFIKETVAKLNNLSRTIEEGLTHADEYYEKNQPLSKYELISYVNSMSNEIKNLNSLLEDDTLPDEAQAQLASTISSFERKNATYNDVINDFGSIRIDNFSYDTQVDIKTTQTYDPYRQTIYPTTEEYLTYIFSVDISNSGSRAEVAIELSGINYREGRLPPMP